MLEHELVLHWASQSDAIRSTAEEAAATAASWLDNQLWVEYMFTGYLDPSGKPKLQNPKTNMEEYFPDALFILGSLDIDST